MSWEVAQTSQEVLASLATPVAGIERQGERGGEHSQRPGSRPLSHGRGSHSEAYFSARCAGRKGPRELPRVLHTPGPLEHQSPELHHRCSLPEPGHEPSVGSRRVQGRGARPSPSRGGHLSPGPAGQRGSEQQPVLRTLRDVCRPEPGSPAPLFSPTKHPDGERRGGDRETMLWEAGRRWRGCEWVRPAEATPADRRKSDSQRQGGPGPWHWAGRLWGQGSPRKGNRIGGAQKTARRSRGRGPRQVLRGCFCHLGHSPTSEPCPHPCLCSVAAYVWGYKPHTCNWATQAQQRLFTTQPTLLTPGSSLQVPP